MSKTSIDKQAVVAALNKILELELAGVVRYTHYSLMIYGYHRIPIVSWLRGQATESLAHATEAGEVLTQVGGEPSLKVGPLLQQARYDIGDILRESLEHETSAANAYDELRQLVEGKSVLLEEYARRLMSEEEQHKGEVEKMLRSPGQ